jgi:hypothetical protein
MPTVSANDVLGRYLIALEDVPVYDIPNGTRIGEIKKGNSTAEVYSYVQRPGGQVWWQFDYTIPGQTPGAYYVLQKDGRFRLSSAAGNVNVTPSSLPGVDVFPNGMDIKKYAIYGGLALAALLLLKK